MARTPEEKRKIAEEFRLLFAGKPSNKAIAAGLAARGNEILVHPPRGANLVHNQGLKGLKRRLPRSVYLQRETAEILRASEDAENKRAQIAEEIARSQAIYRVVADANVLLRAIGSPGLQKSRDIFHYAREGVLDLIVTNAIVSEISNVARGDDLRGLTFSAEQLEELDGLLSTIAINISVFPAPEQVEVVLEDPADTKYVEALVRAREHFSSTPPLCLVSRDGHLLNWQPQTPGLAEAIVTPQVLLDLVRKKL